MNNKTMEAISNSKTGGYEACSNTYAEFLDYEVEDILQKKWTDIISTDDHWELEVLKKTNYTVEFGRLPNSWKITTQAGANKYIKTSLIREK